MCERALLPGLRLPRLWLVASLTVWPMQAAGQWSVHASAGGAAYDLVATTVNTTSGVLELRRDGTRWLQASLGLPLESGGTGWGMAAAGGDWVAAPGHYGLSGTVQGFAYDAGAQPTGWGAFADAGPFVRSDLGPVRIEARVGGIFYHAGGETDEFERALGYAGLSADLMAGRGLTIGGDARYLRASEGGYPFVGARASHASTFGGAWASAGWWASEAVEDPELAAGAYLHLGPRLTLSADLRRDTNDPVFWARPRTTWSVGLRFGLTRVSGDDALVPIDVQTPAAVLGVAAAAVSRPPLIAGDFNDWQPQPLALEGDRWVFRATLEPGVYRFAFTDAGGEWFLPESVESRVDDGFGGENGVLIVR